VLLPILGEGVHNEYITSLISNSGGAFMHLGGGGYNYITSLDCSGAGIAQGYRVELQAG
jgi:hypothetical protein